MNDRACVALLQRALPRLGLRWPGFRKVRVQVCKRLARRIRELGLTDAEAYRGYLDAHAAEWVVLDGLCRITISRFLRDRGVHAFLAATVLPELARRCVDRGASTLRCWSAGCASGEEPYGLVLLWRLGPVRLGGELTLEVVATDAEPVMLERARRACYRGSSLREVPPLWTEQAFDRRDDHWCLRPDYRAPVRLLQQDLRRGAPPGPFDLVLCRNLAFTYYDRHVQTEVLDRLLEVLAPGGALVIGIHERLPLLPGELEVWSESCRIYRMRG